MNLGSLWLFTTLPETYFPLRLPLFAVSLSSKSETFSFFSQVCLLGNVRSSKAGVPSPPCVQGLGLLVLDMLFVFAVV